MDANPAYRFVAVLQDELLREFAAVLQDELLREAADTSLHAQHARRVAEQTRQRAATTRQRAAAIRHDRATWGYGYIRSG